MEKVYQEVGRELYKVVNKGQFKSLFLIIYDMYKKNFESRKKALKVLHSKDMPSAWKFYNFLHDENVLYHSKYNDDLKRHILRTLAYLNNTNEPCDYCYKLSTYKWYNKGQWWHSKGYMIYKDEALRVFYEPCRKKIRTIDITSKSYHKFTIMQEIDLKEIKKEIEEGVKNEKE